MRILYLVHDLADAAVVRRRRALADGGAQIRTIGFERMKRATGAGRKRSGRGDAGAYASEPGAAPAWAERSIGTTEDGRFAKRIGATLRAAAACGDWLDELASSDLVIARTLEMLAIAVAARTRCGAAVPIVYECLDIHRLMGRNDAIGGMLRATESALLRHCALLIVSSPAFLTNHFERRYRRLPERLVLENKVLASELSDGFAVQQPPCLAAPPFRIGWFGVLRCRRSLDMLARLARSSGGAVEVVMRGRPALDAMPDFHAVVGDTPGMTFLGPYDRAEDLPGIYSDVHFNWTVDFFEEGLNSSWLLPNRLYEGSLFGAVPIALRTVQTGAWLARHDCGILLEEPFEQDLADRFSRMTIGDWQAARDRIASLERSDLIETPEAAAQLVAKLASLVAGASGMPSRFGWRCGSEARIG